MGEVRKIMPKGMAESRRGDASSAAASAFACASSLSGRLPDSGSERFSCGLREASASASAGILRGGGGDNDLSAFSRYFAKSGGVSGRGRRFAVTCRFGRSAPLFAKLPSRNGLFSASARFYALVSRTVVHSVCGALKTAQKLLILSKLRSKVSGISPGVPAPSRRTQPLSAGNRPALFSRAAGIAATGRVSAKARQEAFCIFRFFDFSIDRLNWEIGAIGGTGFTICDLQFTIYNLRLHWEIGAIGEIGGKFLSQRRRGAEETKRKQEAAIFEQNRFEQQGLSSAAFSASLRLCDKNISFSPLDRGNWQLGGKFLSLKCPGAENVAVRGGRSECRCG